MRSWHRACTLKSRGGGCGRWHGTRVACYGMVTLGCGMATFAPRPRLVSAHLAPSTLPSLLETRCTPPMRYASRWASFSWAAPIRSTRALTDTATSPPYSHFANLIKIYLCQFINFPTHHLATFVPTLGPGGRAPHHAPPSLRAKLAPTIADDLVHPGRWWIVCGLRVNFPFHVFNTKFYCFVICSSSRTPRRHLHSGTLADGVRRADA